MRDSDADGGLAVVVLAAGKGTRMRSERPKVLHEICGVPMLGHVQRVAVAVGSERLIVVVGPAADGVADALGDQTECVVQAERKGTGHAVMVCEESLGSFDGEILVLYGDTPLLRPETLARMRSLKAETSADLVMLTTFGDTPGRIVRDSSGRIERIVDGADGKNRIESMPTRSDPKTAFLAATLSNHLKTSTRHQ